VHWAFSHAMLGLCMAVSRLAAAGAQFQVDGKTKKTNAR
jgi:hypothetical protein